MSSAFFRRPTDDSSSSSSSSEAEESESGDNPTRQSDNSVEGEVHTLTTESLPSHESLSVGDDVEAVPTPVSSVDLHRTNLLSALLEDFAKTRASDYLNETNPGANFHRSSPEVQSLAERVYQQVSQSLALTGILPGNNEDSTGPQARAAYLAGIENLALGNVQGQGLPRGRARPQLSPPDQNLALERLNIHQQEILPQSLRPSAPGLNLPRSQGPLASPYADLIFSTRDTRRSHYESSFQQLSLLGKGGFGRVYHVYNIFDKKDYAVKKIPLSPRLSQRYRESGHQELEHVLREVQALAQLEHNNVVRYHATWIEEPRQTFDAGYQSRKQSLTVQGRKLIADRPMHAAPSTLKAQPQTREQSEGIVFGFDSRSHTPIRDTESGAPETLWSANETEPELSSARPSEIFTDGNARPNASHDSADDGSVYVLHVQMSVYPSTLAQYLAPTPMNVNGASNGLSRRHCFHLVPALRLLMGIICGLQYIHARGLIHRDIKPSNIFISSLDLSSAGLIPDGYHDIGSCVGCPNSQPYFVNPRIGDFGLVAELITDGNSNQNQRTGSSAKQVGTEYYRPPPVSDSSGKAKSESTVNEKLDVFALGVILIELLWPCMTSTERMHVLRDVQKGKTPQGLTEKIEQEGHEPGLGQLVGQCVSGMIERDPQRRWGCTQVKEWIEKVLAKCKTVPVMIQDERTKADSDNELAEMRKVTSVDDPDVADRDLGARASQ